MRLLCEVYPKLPKIGTALVEAARERAVTFLETRAATAPSSRWDHPADLYVRVLTHEKRFDAAWATVRQRCISLDAQEALARASEAAYPGEALEVYAARADQLADCAACGGW